MNITLFNKKYWARRFSDTQIVKGHQTSGYEDFVVSLNVHPMGNDAIQALPEGERLIKRLEAEGTDVLRSADQDSGVKGDLLYYRGKWYECVSAVEWDHTILSHINYQFTVAPEDGAGTIDLTEPDGEPGEEADDEDE